MHTEFQGTCNEIYSEFALKEKKKTPQIIKPNEWKINMGMFLSRKRLPGISATLRSTVLSMCFQYIKKKKLVVNKQ